MILSWKSIVVTTPLVAFGLYSAAISGAQAVKTGYDKGAEYLRERFAVEVPVTYERLVYGDQSLDELISQSSDEYQIPEDLIRAVMHVETRSENLTRFEAHVYSRTKEADEFERIMISSSHGPMQVMGFNAKTCGLRWQDLYIPKKNLSCGLKILRSCLDRAKGNNLERFRSALGCYNGDRETYPAKVLAAMGEILIDRTRLPEAEAKPVQTRSQK